MSKLNNTVMFACNQGGHFSQMMALHDLFGKYDTVLVTDVVLVALIVVFMIMIGIIVQISQYSQNIIMKVTYVCQNLKIWKRCMRLHPSYQKNFLSFV